MKDASNWEARKREAEENNARPLYYVGSDQVTVFQRPTATIDEFEQRLSYAMGFSVCQTHPGVSADELVELLLRAERVNDHLKDLYCLLQIAGTVISSLDDRATSVTCEGVLGARQMPIKELAHGIHHVGLEGNIPDYLAELLEAFKASGRLQRTYTEEGSRPPDPV